jgi:hypothetical protein
MARRNEQRTSRATRAQEQIQAYEYALRGYSLREIGERMGCSHEKARHLIALEADERVIPLQDQYRRMQLDRLNQARIAVMKVLERKHYHISDGQIVREKNPDSEDDEAGEPYLDDGPVLQAVDRLVKIEDRIAKLLGLNLPVPQQIEVLSESTVDAAIRELEQEIAERTTEDGAHAAGNGAAGETGTATGPAD